MEKSQGAGRQAGIPQGITLVIAHFLPVLAIVSMFPAVPAMIDHFADDPDSRWQVPAMVTAPGLSVALLALFAGVLVDRFGRRKLLLIGTFFYGLFGALPFLLDSLDAVYASRLLLGLSEAAILTTLTTLIGDYFDERGRRNWLTIQGIAGPAMSSGLLYFAGSLVAWRWNAIFLVYLSALPIFFAIWAWLFEPQRDDALRSALAGVQGATTAAGSGHKISLTAMAQIGGVTLFSSVLYYVFIINGGIVWQELGVTDPAAIGRITAFPSLFVLAGAIIFWLLSRLGVGSRGQLLAFLGFLNGGLILIGIATTISSTVIAMAIQQTGAGMAIPTLVAWATGKMPFAYRGRGMGIWTGCFFFGQFVSPLIVSAMRGMVTTMHQVFLGAGIVGLVGAVLLFALMSRSRLRAGLPPVAPSPAAAE